MVRNLHIPQELGNCLNSSSTTSFSRSLLCGINIIYLGLEVCGTSQMWCTPIPCHLSGRTNRNHIKPVRITSVQVWMKMGTLWKQELYTYYCCTNLQNIGVNSNTAKLQNNLICASLLHRCVSTFPVILHRPQGYKWGQFTKIPRQFIKNATNLHLLLQTYLHITQHCSLTCSVISKTYDTAFALVTFQSQIQFLLWFTCIPKSIHR
jgi:hypothetical protein